MLKTLLYATLAGLICASVPAYSDVLLLDAIAEEPANAESGVPRPTRGMKMEAVRQQFGEPVKEHPWVGDPPITRWDYENFSVYFEFDLVLDTVVYRQ
ncbi:MAG: hypothetical protein PVG66_08375 [Chromatiales bacterium]|jgi:hypothetical protein